MSDTEYRRAMNYLMARFTLMHGVIESRLADMRHHTETNCAGNPDSCCYMKPGFFVELCGFKDGTTVGEIIQLTKGELDE